MALSSSCQHATESASRSVPHTDAVCLLLLLIRSAFLPDSQGSVSLCGGASQSLDLRGAMFRLSFGPTTCESCVGVICQRLAEILLCVQRVQEACMDRQGCAGARVLELDLCAPASEMHEAAMEADNAFDGSGVDYLVHNAGRLAAFLCTHLAPK